MMVQRFFVVVLAFALAATDSQNPSKEGYYGQLFIDEERSKVGAGPVAQPPSPEHLLRTDVQGRDVLADVVYGTPATLRLGLIAGVLGVAAGNARVGRWVGGELTTVARALTLLLARPARHWIAGVRSSSAVAVAVGVGLAQLPSQCPQGCAIDPGGRFDDVPLDSGAHQALDGCQLPFLASCLASCLTSFLASCLTSLAFDPCSNCSR